MSEKTPINKGNYDMETPERNARYEKYRGEGWESEYKKYRDNWTTWAENHEVHEYPLAVDIELSTICNLNCPMCFTLTEDFQKNVKRKFMEWELFKKIIDEIAGKVPCVGLSLRGESTLHPDFIKCIRYCKDNGIKEVRFLTNGSTLTEEYFTQMAEAGADWITISVDGVGEMYESIRKPLRFKDTLNKIKNIARIKKERGWHRPCIKIQGIWPSIKDNPTEFYTTFAPYVDQVAFNPLIDYLANDTEIVYEEKFICPQLYQRMIIGSDGTAHLCTNDEEGRQKVGSVENSTIHELWHNEQRNRIRRIHEKGDFKQIELCRRCYLPRKTEETERAMVDGREIIIKNYIGRSQKIGE